MEYNSRAIVVRNVKFTEKRYLISQVSLLQTQAHASQYLFVPFHHFFFIDAHRHEGRSLAKIRIVNPLYHRVLQDNGEITDSSAEMIQNGGI